MSKLVFRSDGLEGFQDRVMEHADTLDRGETLAEETTISFESPLDMLRVLSPGRYSILRALARGGTQSVTSLAEELSRSRDAVARDLRVLSRVGAVLTSTVPDEHGRRMIAASRVASRLDLTSSIRATPGGRAKRSSQSKSRAERAA